MEFPFTTHLDITRSTDFFKMAQFQSMHRLQKLVINQDLLTHPLIEKIEVIPSLDIKRIEIGSEKVTWTAVNNLLA